MGGRHSLGLFSVFTCLFLGCSGGGGSDAGTIIGNNDVASRVADSGLQSSSAADLFVGTYTYSSGAIVVTCTEMSPINQALTGNETIAAGTTSPLVLTNSQGCTAGLDVSGLTAISRSAQTCSTTLQGIPATITMTSYDLTLNGDVATESAAGTAIATMMGSSINCTFTSSANLQKSAK
jgi:hypothetical protein